MKKSILQLGKTLNKTEQRDINGGFGRPDSEVCKIAISIDGTLCLCFGWQPDGTGFCAPTDY